MQFTASFIIATAVASTALAAGVDTRATIDTRAGSAASGIVQAIPSILSGIKGIFGRDFEAPIARRNANETMETCMKAAMEHLSELSATELGSIGASFIGAASNVSSSTEKRQDSIETRTTPVIIARGLDTTIGGIFGRDVQVENDPFYIRRRAENATVQACETMAAEHVGQLNSTALQDIGTQFMAAAVKMIPGDETQ